MTRRRSIELWAAAALGFALPWRTSIEWLGRAVHVSAFEILLPVLLLCDLVTRRARLSGDQRRGGLLALLFAICIGLGERPDTIVSALTLYALAAGWYLAVVLRPSDLAPDSVTASPTIRPTVESFWRGLEIGLLVSTILGFAALFLLPGLVREGPDFCALHGTKNGYTFMVGLVAVRAMTKRRPMAAAGWFMIILFAHARTAALATALVCVASLIHGEQDARLRWRTIGAGTAIALAAAMLVVTADWTGDRLWFAIAIARHVFEVPLFGIGAGRGFGLDLYFKSGLEFGWLGGGLLAIMIASAARRNRSPELWFALLFGLGHDPTRWPLFWMLVMV